MIRGISYPDEKPQNGDQNGVARRLDLMFRSYIATLLVIILWHFVQDRYTKLLQNVKKHSEYDVITCIAIIC